MLFIFRSRAPLNTLLVAALLSAALVTVTVPQAAHAQGDTTLTLSDVQATWVSCAWAFHLTVDMTLEVPKTGAIAAFEWYIETPSETDVFFVPVMTAGPGPDTQFNDDQTFISSSTSTPLPPNTPISFVFRDMHSSAEAGVSVDCSTGAIIDVWSIPAGGPVQPAAVPGPDMVPIPDHAVVGAVLADSVAYFAPRADAATDIVIEAGKTFWVYGMDETRTYYKLMMSGKYFWLPAANVGPNYDDVWHGTPLPTVIVD